MTTPMIRPRSPEEFAALQAALMLDQVDRFVDHLMLIRSQGLSSLIGHVRQSRARVPGMLPFDIPRRIEPQPTRPVLGIKVERRYIAVALARDLTPERVQVRALASPLEKAEAGAVRFASDAAAKFPNARIAIEVASDDSDSRRRLLTSAVSRAVAKPTERPLEIPCETLWTRFSVPGCRTQGQLRNSVRRCWSTIAKRQHNAALDATAIAMLAFVQIHLQQ